MLTVGACSDIERLKAVSNLLVTGVRRQNCSDPRDVHVAFPRTLSPLLE